MEATTDSLGSLRNNMPHRRTTDAAKIRKTLRPDRELVLHARVSGPLDLLRLREQVRQRIRPTGGRPSDASWDSQKLIRFKSAVWQELNELSDKFKREDHVSASPGQLAALIVEEGVKAIKGRR